MRRVAWPVLCVILVAAYLLVDQVWRGGDAWTILSHGSIVTLSSLVAGVACVVAGRHARGTERLGWHLLAAGLGSTTAGNALWLWLELTSPGGAPFASAADCLVLAMVPLSLAGAAALGGLGRVGVRVVLDGLIVSGSLLFVSWCTVLGPILAATPSAAYTAFVFATPLGDVAMASMAFVLLARAEPRRRSTFALVGCGMVAVAVAESGFAYMTQIGAYSAGNLAMNGWIVGFLLIGTGALHSRGSAGQPGRRPETVSSPAWSLLPYVPLAVALITGVCVDIVRDGIGTFGYALTIVVVVLVVVRQLVALRDNAALTRDLRVAVRDLRRREAELERLASHDPLTGLPNRSLFRSRTEQAALQSPAPTLPAVMYIDLDGFKKVNDTLGHAAGDALLVAVADRLRTCVRATDTIARLGGDEFAILVSDPAAAEALTAQAGRIVSAIGQPYDIAGEQVTVGASVGLACSEPGAQTGVDDLLHRADQAMYAAKNAGKNRYVDAVAAGHAPTALI
ncbi:GGDEF domain-containing protein [Paractinoplanes rishiriensis]|uniref:GGDEF domain-containing protein n=1 Tax=Paractinoplanes rishiriensis TaxID=1050105 RepID=UPI00194586BD|nr:GGDEF domain-containing protein [Actinoplanes rishiriensis]